MAHLKDLDVQFVSLVDRAAVRDPVNKDEPMRFLIWKRDGAPEQAAPASVVADPSAAIAAAFERQGERTRELLARAEALTTNGKETVSQQPTAVAKAEQAAEELRRAQPGRLTKREAFVKAIESDPDLAREYLEEMRRPQAPPPAPAPPPTRPKLASLAKAEKIAIDLRKSDTSLSHAAATQKAFDEHPDLAAQYRQDVLYGGEMAA